MDLKKVMQAGRQFYSDKNLAEEQDKLGTFRVGTSGCMVEVSGKTEPCGHCPRKAALRSLGIQEQIEPNKMLMFGGGRAQETVILAELVAGLGPDFVVKQEEDCPVSFTCANGTVVSGRPDFVIFDKAGTPIHGVEAKLVCSVWTHKTVFFEKLPKSDHLIQAGIYSKLIGAPWSIVYSSRTEFIPPEWAVRKKWFEGNDEVVERNAKGEVNKLLCGETYYHIAWDDGRLFWARDEDEEYKPTHITWQGVLDFYNAVEKSIAKKEMPARPTPVSMIDLSSTFDACSPKYCNFSGFCDALDAGTYGWDRFLKECKKLSR